MANNDSAYGGLFIIAAVLGVLLLVCGGGAFFFLFSAKSVATAPPALITKLNSNQAIEIEKFSENETISFLKANGPVQLPKDNSLTENFVKLNSVTSEQHEHFKTVITKYRNEIEEIASPKTAYSLTDNNQLKIEISPFETDGTEIEKDLREELLEQLSEKQIKAIQTNVNFEEPFYGFGQFTIEIEFGPSESKEGFFTYNKKMRRENDTNSIKSSRRIKDNPAWQHYEDKRQELLKK